MSTSAGGFSAALSAAAAAAAGVGSGDAMEVREGERRWLARATRVAESDSSWVLERMTVPTPRSCIRSMTVSASARERIRWPVSSSASNWLGTQTSASGRMMSR